MKMRLQVRQLPVPIAAVSAVLLLVALSWVWADQPSASSKPTAKLVASVASLRSLADATTERFKIPTSMVDSDPMAAYLEGKVDLMWSCRFLRLDEMKSAIKNGVYPFQQLVGRRPLIVYVHADNPVKSLSLDQITAIYSGNVRNWSELGGADKPIDPILPDSASLSGEIVQSIVLNGRKPAEHVRTASSSRSPLAEVATSSGGIGFAFAGSPGKGVHSIAVGNLQGTGDAVRKGSYPLSCPVVLFSNCVPTDDGLLAAALAFYGTREGQSILTKLEIVPLLASPESD
jgi:phosphate transport system substrate-binding protein